MKILNWNIKSEILLTGKKHRMHHTAMKNQENLKISTDSTQLLLLKVMIWKTDSII